jgi:hypothetical protein
VDGPMISMLAITATAPHELAQNDSTFKT